MQALSEELQQIGNDAGRRREIIEEIIGLGKLYRAVREQAESPGKKS